MKIPNSKDIKYLRTSVFRMSQPTWATIMGSCVATLSRWESGKVVPFGLQAVVLQAMKDAVANYGEQRVRGVDWVEMLQRRGVTAVLAGIFNFATVPPKSSPPTMD